MAAPELFLRLLNSMRVFGLRRTMLRAVRYPLSRIRSVRQRRSIFSSTDSREVFTRIYRSNWWGSEESVSGTGSTLAYTENLRARLPLLLDQFRVGRILDAPCGDFNWMRLVLADGPLCYLGGDIVQELVQRNQRAHGTERIRFTQLDITQDKLPDADLWICRDCLFHLSFEDIRLVFENFARSSIPYLLTTTHMNQTGFLNMDIRTGDARLIDLFSAPFNLSRECLMRIDDWLPPDPPREMVLIGRGQVQQALPAMRQLIPFAIERSA